MIEVKGTVDELKKFYAQLGLVDTTTKVVASHGSVRFHDPIASKGMGFKVTYEMNPRTGMLRRRRSWGCISGCDGRAYTQSYTTYLNSEKKVLQRYGTVPNIYTRTVKIYTPIHSIEGLLSRAISPILHYRQVAEKKGLRREAHAAAKQ